MNIIPIDQNVPPTHENHPEETGKNSSEPEIEALNVYTMSPPDPCLLLHLPAEIRSMIFEYVLPTTLVSERKGLRWKKGTTNVLAISKKVHDEAAHIMYSQSTFGLKLHRDCIIHGFHEIGNNPILPFPEAIGQRYIPLLQYVEVRVIFDTYAVLMEEGVTGPTVRGLRGQVEALCGILRRLPTLKRLCVHLQAIVPWDTAPPETKLEVNETILKLFFENFPGAIITLSDEEALQRVDCADIASTGSAQFIADQAVWHRTLRGQYGENE
ncbi:MAG: hypothetical protein Q9210_006257 [Variospora velana]